MNQSAYMEAVESSSIHQGTQEESRPPVRWVLGRQKVLWAMEPAGAC